MFRSPPFKRKGDFIRVGIEEAERDVLRYIAESSMSYNDPNHPGSRRLFPTSYADDSALDEEFALLFHNQLMDQRSSRISDFLNTLNEDELSIDEAETWMIVLNDIRLVFGDALDVDENGSVGQNPQPNGADRQSSAPAIAFDNDVAEGVYNILSYYVSLLTQCVSH